MHKPYVVTISSSKSPKIGTWELQPSKAKKVVELLMKPEPIHLGKEESFASLEEFL